MPGLLSRSKSMRLLKGSRKDTTRGEDIQRFMPSVGTSQTDIDRLHSATPISRTEVNLEVPDTATRPSTSGGPGDRRTQFHMKTNPVPFTHSQCDLTFTSPTKSSNVLYLNDQFDPSEGVIGIALGSPTAGSHWNPSPQSTTMDLPGTNDPMASFSTFSDSPVPFAQDPPKSKLSRWKSLFRKTGAIAPPQDKNSFYQLAQTVTATRAARADSHHDEEPTESKGTPKQLEERGRLPSPPTFKPDIRASRKYGEHEFIAPQSPPESTRTRARAFTAGSLPTNPRMSVQRSATTPIPISKETTSRFPPPQVVVSKSTQDAQGPSSGKPLLDVSIPDVKLERYSVMFGSLLQPGSTRSSSLLMRRQGNPEKLKPLNELSVKDDKEKPVEHKLQRRATSPGLPSPSPRLSLFPNTTSSRASSPRSSSVPRTKALQRSKTAPEKSPLNQMFRTTGDADDSPEEVRKPSSSLKPPTSTTSRSQQMAITPTSIHSFESETDSITLVVGTTGRSQKICLDEREPEWEICTKPVVAKKEDAIASSTLTRTESQRQPKITKFSALSSNPASAPLDAPSPLQRISSMRTPPLSARRAGEKQAGNEARKEGGEAPAKAMVGVARSVSVSRATSPRALIKSATDVNSPERFVERQILTPTMVEVKNRRSQRVQLVDA